MHSEKDLQVEITKFTRLCKDKQEQVLNTFANEEKRLNAEYRKKLDKLLKRQHKESEQLSHQLKKKQKALRQQLKKEQQTELRLFKRHEGLKPNSSSGISETVQLPSECQPARNEKNRVLPPFPQTVDALSGAGVGRQPTDEDQDQQLDSAGAQHGLRTNGHNDGEPGSDRERKLDRLMERLKQQMDERMEYKQSSARLAEAGLEWKFAQERHNLKREYTELIAEFKQNRLISLSQLKKNQLRGYYDIHRKWLTEQHTRDLDLRQRTCQEALKRLTSAQAVERNTACRLAETTAKGQRQMTRILNAIESKADNGCIGRPASSLSTQDLYTAGSDNIGVAQRSMAVDTTLIDVLFPQTGESTPEISPKEAIATHKRSNYSLQVAEAHRETGSSSIAPSERDGVTSLHGSRAAGFRHFRSRYEPTRHGLRHAKSMQSLQSTLVTCRDMQRSLISSISRQHMDQWAEVMNRERELTELLVRAQANQKQGLITEEAAALRRTELEQNYRMAHLAVYLEATEKFMEKEFADERNRLMEHYFKGISDEAQPYSRTSPFPFLEEYNYQQASECKSAEVISEMANSLEPTDCHRRLDKSVETNEEDFHVTLSINRRRPREF